MPKWRIPMGWMNYIIECPTAEQAVERAEAWRTTASYDGPLVATAEPEGVSR